MPYKDNKKKQEHAQALRNKRKANGICTSCGEADVSNTEYFSCRKCLDKKAKINLPISRKRTKYRKDNGLCLRCGKKNPDKNTNSNCASCRKNQNLQTKKLMTNRIAQGLCASCSRPLSENEKKQKQRYCNSCRIYRNKQAQLQRKQREARGIYDNEIKLKRYYKNIEKGICVGCGQVPPKKGLKRCKRCLDKAKQQSIKRREYLKENNLCRGCTRKLPDNSKFVKCDNCRKLETTYREHIGKKTKLRELRIKYKSLGRCQNCSAKLKGNRIGKTNCTKCSQKRTQRNRKLREKRYEQVKCISCDKNLTIAEAKYKNCASCRKKTRNRMNRKTLSYRENNLCIRCGGDRQGSNLLTCPKCRKRDNERGRKIAAYNRNPKKCYRCDDIIPHKDSKWQNCPDCRLQIKYAIRNKKAKELTNTE